ncbi:helix-turn-helix transcriptional regulator [Streptomyces sp. WMMC1477]|uniref:helix-turn-helix transcriptional regulator n=1 Tax=Streptomyces sp. WMMC1477 TaxID=3015155 RepID=UPI0022B74B23|nr:TrmB family transcriptional regulator [Streptomyces sp. WMMC1477]MCZ7433452.1 LuxR C-terminal-related transcriptional regulator [Streptomyces sp. WMMC1477]
MFLLEPVGFGRTENDAYLGLLDLKRATAEELGEHLGVPAAGLLPSLQRLLEAGLVQQLGFTPAVYAAVPPDESLAALIDHRRGELARMRSHVEELADRLRAGSRRAGRDQPVVELLDGEDAVLAAVARIQLQAREEVIAVDAPPYIGGGPGNPNDLELNRLAAGVAYRCVYSREALDSPETLEAMRRCTEAGEQARILPGVTLKMVVADRSTAMLPVSYTEPDPGMRLLVHGSALVDVLVCCFEQLWARATPVDARQAECGPTGRDRELLSLLASGLKDRTIARALGVTERTVGRRLTELMAELGVETRFQAGVQAARRGWI